MGRGHVYEALGLLAICGPLDKVIRPDVKSLGAVHNRLLRSLVPESEIAFSWLNPWVTFMSIPLYFIPFSPICLYEPLYFNYRLVILLGRLVADRWLILHDPSDRRYKSPSAHD